MKLFVAFSSLLALVASAAPAAAPNVTIQWGFPAPGTASLPAVAAKPNQTLIFNYAGNFHNVQKFPTAAAYAACDFSGATMIGATGPVSTKAMSGISYYGCSMPGHCEAGMKVMVTVKPVTPVKPVKPVKPTMPHSTTHAPAKTPTPKPT